MSVRLDKSFSAQMNEKISRREGILHPCSILEKVKTVEGRIFYCEFLKNNQNAPPLVKLYAGHGEIPEDIDVIKIKNHVKEVMLSVHPDKNSPSEKDICDRIFKEVKEAERLFLSESFSTAHVSTDFFDLNPFVNRSIKSQFKSSFLQGRICEASRFVEKIEVEEFKEDPKLSMMAAVSCLRVGKLDIARVLGAESPSFIKSLDLLSKALNSAGSQEEKERDLRLVIQELQQLGKTSEYRKIFLEAVPYEVYESLKDLSLDRPEEFEYFLRLAIRACPDGLESKKRKLMDELRILLKGKFGESALSPIDFKKEVVNCGKHLINKAIKKLTSLDLNESDRDLLRKIFDPMENFSKEEISLLLKNIDKILHPSYLSSFFYDCSDQSKELLCYWKNSFLGFKNYLSGDKNAAVEFFDNSKNLVCVGLIECECYDYEGALLSWDNFLKQKEEDDKPLIPLVQEHAFRLMTQYDTTFIPENSVHRSRMVPPGHLEGFQEEILLKMHLPGSFSEPKVVGDSASIDISKDLFDRIQFVDQSAGQTVDRAFLEYL